MLKHIVMALAVSSVVLPICDLLKITQPYMGFLNVGVLGIITLILDWKRL